MRLSATIAAFLAVLPAFSTSYRLRHLHPNDDDDACVNRARPDFFPDDFFLKHKGILPVELMQRWTFNSLSYHDCVIEQAEKLSRHKHLQPGLHIFADASAIATLSDASIIVMPPSVDEFDYSDMLGANGEMKNAFCTSLFHDRASNLYAGAMGGKTYNATNDWDGSFVNKAGRFDIDNRRFLAKFSGPVPSDPHRWSTGVVYGPLKQGYSEDNEVFAHAVEDESYYPMLSLSRDLVAWKTFRLCNPESFMTWKSDTVNVSDANFIFGQADSCLSVYTVGDTLYFGSRSTLSSHPEVNYNWGIRAAGFYKVDTSQGCLRLDLQSWLSLDDCVRQCWQHFKCNQAGSNLDFDLKHYRSCRNSSEPYARCFGLSLRPSMNSSCLSQLEEMAQCSFSCRTETYSNSVSEVEPGLFSAAMPAFSPTKPSRLYILTSRNGIHYRRPLPVPKTLRSDDMLTVPPHHVPSIISLDGDTYRMFVPLNGSTTSLLSWPRYKLFGLIADKDNSATIELKPFHGRRMTVIHTPVPSNQTSWTVTVRACSSIRSKLCETFRLHSLISSTVEFDAEAPIRTTIEFANTILHGVKLE
jgi:hypothetical protein